MQEAVKGAPIISARQLRVQYGDREILHGLDFDILHGETVVILGGSGSGKSTLLRTIVGLQKPHSGELLVKGTDLGKASDREMREIRKAMGLSFQGGADWIPYRRREYRAAPAGTFRSGAINR